LISLVEGMMPHGDIGCQQQRSSGERRPAAERY